MKKQFIILFILLLKCALVFSQSDDFQDKIANAKRVIKLIQSDSIYKLSDLISYPIKRPNPIPDIKNKDEFVLYYYVLIDQNFKDRLAKAMLDSKTTIDRSTGFGILNGDLWFNEDGKIITINYHSTAEHKLQSALQTEIQRSVHSSVANWKMNELVCETDRFTIRIDEMADSSLRYVSWSKSKTFKDKPDLVINNGSYQFQGTRGGMIYTFINNDWTYELDRVTMAESDDQYGLFLTIYQNGQQKSKYKCRETK